MLGPGTLVWISRWKDERVSALCCNKASGMMNIALLHDYMIIEEPEKDAVGSKNLALGMEFLGSVPMACPWPCTQPHMAHVLPLLSCAFPLGSKVKPTPLPSNSETNEFKRQV